MKRFTANGQKIKLLRANRDRCATQKEFAHEVGISERHLRLIENQNADVPMDVLERIAQALRVPTPSVAIALDGLRLVSSSPAREPVPTEKDVIMPRFDTYPASVVAGETALLEMAERSQVLISHILTDLTSETDAYAEELLALLESVTWDKRDILVPIDGKEQLRLRRRTRELLVLLKGNDVWVYATDHFKYLPEGYSLPPEGTKRQTQNQLIFAFGAPGEYGETSLSVPVDHGQPWVCKGTISF